MTSYLGIHMMFINSARALSMTASQICPSIQITLLLFHLDGVGVLEQLGELALLALELRVAANVLLADEDVGHRALLGHLLKGILDRGAVVCVYS